MTKIDLSKYVNKGNDGQHIKVVFYITEMNGTVVVVVFF